MILFVVVCVGVPCMIVPYVLVVVVVDHNVVVLTGGFEVYLRGSMSDTANNSQEWGYLRRCLSAWGFCAKLRA